MNKSEETPANKICAWCGKPCGNSIFGGRNVSYCDFRCATAKDFYPALFSFILILFTLSLAVAFFPGVYFAMIDHFSPLPYPIPEILTIGVFVLLTGCEAFFAYALIIAFRLRQERESSSYV